MSIDEELARQVRLVDALREPSRYPHPVPHVEVIETHVSWVLLAGERVYKLKKAVDYGFLDYSTLERRRRFCDEELRLNRRTAPDLYLAVVPIGGSPEAPRIGAAGPALEWAVAMTRFPQELLLSRQLAAGTLDGEQIDALARRIAEFHRAIPPAPADSAFGTPAVVWHPMGENFDQLRERLSDPASRRRLDGLETWARRRFDRLEATIAARRAAGRVRECHGDLHLNNLIGFPGRPTPFDAIEFNPDLRFIDVVSEVAFLTMDLDSRGRPDLGWRFLDGYLAHGGDYAGMALLRFYQAYRAMVRAKVAAIRLGDPHLEGDERSAAQRELTAYTGLAERYAEPPRPRLLLMHGLSGSGKSQLAGRLLQRLGAIRLRSDVVRKALFGLAPDADSRSGVDGGIYGAAAGARTYERLETLAQELLRAGLPVIVDAATLRREQREPFRALAGRLGIPFDLIALRAEPALLRERITARSAAGRDPSEADIAVLERQLAAYRPPGADEEPLAVDGTDTDAADRLAAQLRT